MGGGGGGWEGRKTGINSSQRTPHSERETQRCSSGSAEEDNNSKRATARKMLLRRARWVHYGLCAEDTCRGKECTEENNSMLQVELVLNKLLTIARASTRAPASLSPTSPEIWQHWPLRPSACLSVLERRIRVALDLLSPKPHHCFTWIVGMKWTINFSMNHSRMKV